MCNTAAHNVDRILPNVPLRQWVLSLPFELRMLAAYKADVLTALGRFFIESIFVVQKKRVGIKDAECGAITYVQRFGGSVNLNVHFHALVLDGVCTRAASGEVRFHAAPAPNEEQIQDVARRVHKRAVRRRRKRGYMDERGPEERGNDNAELSALDDCARIALQGGTFANMGEAERAGCGTDEDVVDRVLKRRFSATFEDFNVHAAVCVAAHHDEARERLVRYCARPSFALDRISILPDGRIAYLVKYPRRHATHRIMAPVEFLARLAALIPPPRYPLTRYHGAPAPHSKWRPDVIPRAPTAGAGCTATRGPPSFRAVNASKTGRAEKTAGTSKRSEADRAARKTPIGKPRSHVPEPPALVLPHLGGTHSGRAAAERSAFDVDFRLITVGHSKRLLDGALLANSPRVNWSQLLRRRHAVDVLECPKCHGRLRVLAAVMGRASVADVLGRLGLAANANARPAPRARDPAATAG